jgi:large subunit ribosomal protein L29
MKSNEYMKELRGKSAGDLKTELEALRKEQFNLRMQAATGATTKSSDIAAARKKIARVKTMLNQQQAKS